jgi:sodium-independent sulfate anion transporter 11
MDNPLQLVLILCPPSSPLSSTDLGWLSGDLIAGLTVGMVLVPQGMSYAQVIISLLRSYSS